MDCRQTMVPQCSIQYLAPIHSQDIRPDNRPLSSPIRGELENIQSPATEMSDQGTAVSVRPQNPQSTVSARRSKQILRF